MKRSHSDGDREFNPETLALGYGYDPELSQLAVKPPVFPDLDFPVLVGGRGQALLRAGLRST